MSLTLDTPVLQLPQHGVARLGAQTARRLALALANVTGKRDASETTVEDLLLYLPMRYEDRSNLARIADLQDGMEASLELFVKLCQGRPVGRWRSFRQRLFIFEISATDRERTGKDVVVWTYLSGLNAQRIIENYEKKFSRGVRFIAFGKWEMDPPRQTFSLRLNKPDEIEVLPPLNKSLPMASGAATEESGDDLTLYAIHVGRCVPVYRKINEIRPKQLREIIHRVL